jgi:hypothetical protein
VNASLILLFIFALEYAVKIQQSQGRFVLNGTNWFLALVFDVNSLIGLDNAMKTSTEAVLTLVTRNTNPRVFSYLLVRMQAKLYYQDS